MANQLILKKGLDAARTVITPAEGELVYATDTKKVFIGDGATAGGNRLSSGLAWSVKTSAYTASVNDGVFANTATAAFSVTLPAAAGLAVGDTVAFADVAPFNWGTNALTIIPTGATIDGAVGNFIADVARGSFSLVYSGSDWVVVDFQTAQAPAGGGKVLQVVHTNTKTVTVTSSSTYTDTAILATITPTLASSKILVLVNAADGYVNGNSAAGSIGLKLLRGVTVVSLLSTLPGMVYPYIAGKSWGVTPIFGSHLDAPAATTPVTYKVQLASVDNSAQVQINANGASGADSTITLMEIAA